MGRRAWTDIETANADRIEVIRGPASVLYGSDALGGVINVLESPASPTRSAARRSPAATWRCATAPTTASPTRRRRSRAPPAGSDYRLEGSGRSSTDVRTPDYVLWNSANRAVGGSGTLGLRGGWGSVAGTFSLRDERVELTDEDPLATPLQKVEAMRARVTAQLPVGASHLDLQTGWERNRRREFEDESAGTADEVATGLLATTWTADARLHHPEVGPFTGSVGVSGLYNGFEKFGEESVASWRTARTTWASLRSSRPTWDASG